MYEYGARVVPPVDWHPRRLARPTEWTLVVPGQPEPIAVVRRLIVRGRTAFRAVTWAPRSADRTLIGYFDSGDAAAEECWQRYLERQHDRHEVASRTHGSAERGGPAG